VSLIVAAPADLVVALASSSAAVSVPPTVTIPAGAVAQTFPATTVNAPPNTAATITATYGGVSRSATLTVIAYPTVTAMSCTTTAPKGGTSVACTVALADPAPPGGWVLALSSDDNTIAGPLQSQVNVPAGTQTFQFDVVTAPQVATAVTTIRVSDAASGLVLFSQAITVTAS
jgi:hypothetical protein